MAAVVGLGADEILIIAELHDRLASAFRDVAVSAGFRVIILPHVQASHLFTIEVSGADSTVHPNLPAFYRSPGQLAISASVDQRFLFSESMSTLWAALALSSRRVINRPNRYGLLAGWTPSVAVLGLRTKTPVAAETYARHLADIERVQHLEQWITNFDGGEVIPYRQYLEREGGLRASDGFLNSVYQLIVVVTEKAFVVGSQGAIDDQLARESVRISLMLDISFASIGWEIDQLTYDFRLVSFNPNPPIQQVQPVWSDVSKALLGLLT